MFSGLLSPRLCVKVLGKIVHHAIGDIPSLEISCAVIHELST
jgi:hypothetical protein